MLVRPADTPSSLQPVWLYAAVLLAAIALTDAARAWVPALQGRTFGQALVDGLADKGALPAGPKVRVLAPASLAEA